MSRAPSSAMCMEVSNIPMTPIAARLSPPPGAVYRREPKQKADGKKARLLDDKHAGAASGGVVKAGRVPCPHHDEFGDRSENRIQ